MTITQKISGRILYHMAQGMTVDQAIEAVLGKGAYEKLAGEIYDALRKEG